MPFRVGLKRFPVVCWDVFRISRMTSMAIRAKCSFRFYLSQTLLLTVREDPISAPTVLRLAIRDGRRFAGTLALLNALLEYQGDALRKIADAAEDRLERIEDRVFGVRKKWKKAPFRAYAGCAVDCSDGLRRAKILALLHRSMPAAGTRDEHEHLW